MILLAAYGNFQDRIVLGLALPLEEGGPLAPVQVKFSPSAFPSAPVLPPDRKLPKLVESGTTVVERDPEWSELSYDELQSRLEKQRARTPRLPIPAWDDLKKNLPPAFAARPIRLREEVVKDPLGSNARRLQVARTRSRSRDGDGHVLVALPRALHDPDLRRIPTTARAGQRLCGLLREEARGVLADHREMMTHS